MNPLMLRLLRTLVAVFCLVMTASSSANSSDMRIGAAPETPTADKSAEARRERLRLAIESMKVSQHEVRPDCSPCLGWGTKPLVVMGTEPQAASIPSNWPGKKFPDWKAIVSWFVIYEGQGGNKSTNAAVEIDGIELWYLSRSTKAWHLIQSAQHPKWDSTLASDAVTIRAKSALRTLDQSVKAYVPSSSNVVHGGLPQAELPWSQTDNRSDVDALYLSVRHRLTLRNTGEKDDKQNALLAVQAGIDYYPYMGARLSDLNAPYVPGAGLGQFIKASPEWRYSTVFLKSRKLSEQEVLAAPPPAFLY